jgi:hypothetical protein
MNYHLVATNWRSPLIQDRDTSRAAAHRQELSAAVGDRSLSVRARFMVAMQAQSESRLSTVSIPMLAFSSGLPPLAPGLAVCRAKHRTGRQVSSERQFAAAK